MDVNTDLLHYRILRKFDEGGMGEVYLAEDTRLRRRVAIKCLPDRVRNDPESLTRFRREALAVACLKHPNIAVIHALEEAEPPAVGPGSDKRRDVGAKHAGHASPLHFIVMEYVEGRTLRDELSRRRNGLDIDRFFQLSVPLADAMAHAHARGIVHRDLKPGNIMLTDDDTPKILDFGLSRIGHVVSVVPSSRDTTEDYLPTPSPPGVVVGTPAYMSPEQTQGVEVDARSDVFSFGVTLYEMLTARRPFTGENYVSVVSSILKDEPKPVYVLKPAIPHHLWRIIRKCLHKNVNRRYQSMIEVRNDLEDLKRDLDIGAIVLETGAFAGAGANSTAALWHRSMVLIVGALILGAGVLGTYATRFWWAADDEPVMRLPVPAGGRLAGTDIPAISPDGRRIAYTYGGRLWIRELDRLEPVEVEDSQGAYHPFWSPGSDYVGYVRESSRENEPLTLMKVPVQGGPGVRLCSLPGQVTMGATWGTDGRIIVSAAEKFDRASLFVVSDQSGTPERFLSPDTTAGEWMYGFPLFLPDNKTLLYSTLTADTTMHLMALREGEKKQILQEAVPYWIMPAYSPTGRLVYAHGSRRKSEIWTAPFSLSNLEITGEKVLITQNGFFPTVAAWGTLLYRSARAPLDKLVWVDRGGNIEGNIGQAQDAITEIAMSPNGRRVAVCGVEQRNASVWMHDINGSKTRLTYDADAEGAPVWSPDGRRLVFTRGVRDTRLFIVDSDGKSAPSALFTEPPGAYGGDWSSDGRTLIFQAENPKTKNDLWTLRMDISTAPEPFLQSLSNETGPVFSPDGRYVAYASDETGQYEIYVVSYPDGSGKQQVSQKGGIQPIWGRNGELFYVEGNTLMAVQVDTRSVFRKGSIHALFSGDRIETTLYGLGRTVGNRYFAPSPDGQHFAVVTKLQNMDMDMILVRNGLGKIR